MNETKRYKDIGKAVNSGIAWMEHGKVIDMEVRTFVGWWLKCGHGKGKTEYCMPCGRINSND